MTLFKKENRSHTMNGILFVALFALSSMYAAEAPWLVEMGISSLIIAIVLGIFYGNTLRHQLPSAWSPGIQFTAKRILRLAIILYGFRVTFQEILSIGMEGLIIDVLVVTLTLIGGAWVGIKVLKLDKHLAILIAGGAAICGAAAVLAMEDVIKSEPFKTSVAIGTVVLFGTLSMLVYPSLQHAGLFGFTETQFGIFAGASVHEVAQALVAGNNVSDVSANTAVIVKMTRVLLLVPVLILLSLYVSRTTKQTNHGKKTLSVPWFAILFAVVIGFNSLQLLPASTVDMINKFDSFLLTMAMAAIGIETNLTQIKSVGLKPVYFSVGLLLWLFGSVWLMVIFI